MRRQRAETDSVGESMADIYSLLATLSQQLDPHHSRDSELHQLWLETEWLKSNLESNDLCLPRNWELIIFRLVRSHDSTLKNYPEAFKTACSLANALRKSVAMCS